jgi:hypothetical protein
MGSDYLTCSGLELGTNFETMVASGPEFGSWQQQEIFSPTLRPDRFCIPSILLCSAYQGAAGVKLCTHVHLVLRSRMRGAKPPGPLLHGVVLNRAAGNIC